LRAAQLDRGDEHQHVHDQVHLRGQRGEDPVGVRDARNERVQHGDEGDHDALRGDDAYLDALAVDLLEVRRQESLLAPDQQQA
jgi:hypothetical protein